MASDTSLSHIDLALLKICLLFDMYIFWHDKVENFQLIHADVVHLN